MKELGIDRPTHQGGHPDWNKEVFGGLTKIGAGLGESGMAEGSDVYHAKARQFLNELQHRLRREMPQKSKMGFLPSDMDGSYA